MFDLRWPLQNSWPIYSQTLRYLHMSRKSDASIEAIKSEWSQFVLNHLNFKWSSTGPIARQRSVLFVGNHISYLDMPLLMATTPSISFVAKQEVSHWPVFGSAAKAIQTVFVKRENSQSRQYAREAVKKALSEGRRVVIFPSGTTTLKESKPWRWGAFEIAAELGCDLQPFRIQYKPLRKVAYIDQDFFLTHLYKLSRTKGLRAHVDFHAPIRVTDARQSCLEWQNWARENFIF